MAAVLRRTFGSVRVTFLGKTNCSSFVSARFSTNSLDQQSSGKGNGWFNKLSVTGTPTEKKSHSRMLSDKEVIYALYTHNIRPESVDKYLASYEEHVNLIRSQEKDLKYELVGSWTVEVGDLDQALHLWKYTGGYECVDRAQVILSKNEDYQRLVKECGNYLRSRHLQYLLAFSYWPPSVSRNGHNKYEIRSYSLKPGSMIEWGNNWAKAINYRRNNDEPFAGFFSQIGRLYNVHHIWCYKDLQTRKETREIAWRSPGWDQCVAFTVPLIRDMHCRILSPTTFSPTQ